MSAACEKQTSFVSCLAPRTRELPELLMFSLSSNPDQLHQLCGAVTLRLVHLAFLLEDLSPPPPTCIPVSRPLLKDKVGPRKARMMTDPVYLSASPFVKTSPGRCYKKKNQKKIINLTEKPKRFAFGKNRLRSIRAVKSDGWGPSHKPSTVATHLHPFYTLMNVQTNDLFPWAASGLQSRSRLNPHVILEIRWSDEMK